MAQEYDNYIDLLGSHGERQQFIADALRLSPKWGWDWVKIDFNDQAFCCGDSGRSHLDFYTHGFPDGLEELMKLYPNVILEGRFFDMSYPEIHRMMLQNNIVFKDSTEAVWFEGEYPDDRDLESPALEAKPNDTVQR